MRRLVLLVVAFVLGGGFARAGEDVAALVRRATEKSLAAAAAMSREDVEKGVAASWEVSLGKRNGRWELLPHRLVTMPATRFCQPDDPQVVIATGLLFATSCSTEGRAVLEGLAQEAMARTRKELAAELSALPASPPRERLKSVGRRASAVLQRHLRETGWVSKVLALWDRHVSHRSECTARLLEQMAKMMPQVLGEDFSCTGWWQYFAFGTNERDEVAEHIVYAVGQARRDGRDRTIEQLIESGLTYCMGRIVREDDPELAAQVLKLRPGVPGMIDSRALDRRARKLWRRRGVDRWFEEVKREGKVPEKLRLRILQCAGGYLPPVVEGQEGAPAGDGEPGTAPAH